MGLSQNSGARIKFWGVRGSIATPGPETVRYGGNTSCVELRADGEIIVLDAGTGIRPLGLSLAREFKDRPLSLTLLISHTHWDHIQGFPFFAPAWDAKSQVKILGYDGASSGLQQTFAGQMESPYFPVSLHEMPGNIRIQELKELEFEVGAVKVSACVMNHPGIAVGFRLKTSGGDVVYIPDNEPCDAASHDHPDGRAMNQKILEFLKDADVFIADAQYDPEEYATRVGWGHGCVHDVVTMAAKAGVKRLYLFHHDPAHDDAKLDALLADACRCGCDCAPDMEIFAAREGEEIVLPPR